MKPPEKFKCGSCLHSRIVVSENGVRPVCTLPTKQAVLCMAGMEDKSLILEEWDNNENA